MVSVSTAFPATTLHVPTTVAGGAAKAGAVDSAPKTSTDGTNLAILPIVYSFHRESDLLSPE
jgi:hypothetical protein